MRIKKFNFTLLEVLIALLLISAALPLLIAPFFYASFDRQEALEKIRLEKAAQFAITQLLIDLHTKKIPPQEVEAGRSYPVHEEWFEALEYKSQISGAYQFEKKWPLTEQSQQGPELWQVRIDLKMATQKNPLPFVYEFILIPSQTPA